MFYTFQVNLISKSHIFKTKNNYKIKKYKLLKQKKSNEKEQVDKICVCYNLIRDFVRVLLSSIIIRSLMTYIPVKPSHPGIVSSHFLKFIPLKQTSAG